MNKFLPKWTIGFSQNNRIIFTHLSKPADKKTEGIDWVKTKVEINTGGFSGNAKLMLTLTDIIDFKKQLEILYKKLKGIAILKTIEEQIELKIEGDSTGHIELTGYLKDNIYDENKLNFIILLDQSFLPKTISELNSTLDFIKKSA